MQAIDISQINIGVGAQKRDISSSGLDLQVQKWNQKEHLNYKTIRKTMHDLNVIHHSNKHSLIKHKGDIYLLQKNWSQVTKGMQKGSLCDSFVLNDIPLGGSQPSNRQVNFQLRMFDEPQENLRIMKVIPLNQWCNQQSSFAIQCFQDHFLKISAPSKTEKNTEATEYFSQISEAIQSVQAQVVSNNKCIERVFVLNQQSSKKRISILCLLQEIKQQKICRPNYDQPSCCLGYLEKLKYASSSIFKIIFPQKADQNSIKENSQKKTFVDAANINKCCTKQYDNKNLQNFRQLCSQEKETSHIQQIKRFNTFQGQNDDDSKPWKNQIDFFRQFSHHNKGKPMVKRVQSERLSLKSGQNTQRKKYYHKLLFNKNKSKKKELSVETSQRSKYKFHKKNFQRLDESFWFNNTVTSQPFHSKGDFKNAFGQNLSIENTRNHFNHSLRANVTELDISRIVSNKKKIDPRTFTMTGNKQNSDQLIEKSQKISGKSHKSSSKRKYNRLLSTQWKEIQQLKQQAVKGCKNQQKKSSFAFKQISQIKESVQCIPKTSTCKYQDKDSEINQKNGDQKKFARKAKPQFSIVCQEPPLFSHFRDASKIAKQDEDCETPLKSLKQLYTSTKFISEMIVNEISYDHPDEVLLLKSSLHSKKTSKNKSNDFRCQLEEIEEITFNPQQKESREAASLLKIDQNTLLICINKLSNLKKFITSIIDPIGSIPNSMIQTCHTFKVKSGIPFYFIYRTFYMIRCYYGHLFDAVLHKFSAKSAIMKDEASPNSFRKESIKELERVIQESKSISMSQSECQQLIQWLSEYFEDNNSVEEALKEMIVAIRKVNHQNKINENLLKVDQEIFSSKERISKHLSTEKQDILHHNSKLFNKLLSKISKSSEMKACDLHSILNYGYILANINIYIRLMVQNSNTSYNQEQTMCNMSEVSIQKFKSMKYFTMSDKAFEWSLQVEGEKHRIEKDLKAISRELLKNE